MNHLTCTLTPGLGVLIRDTGVLRAQICQLQLLAAWLGGPRGISDLCELALTERQNKNKVSSAASLPASLVIFK